MSAAFSILGCAGHSAAHAGDRSSGGGRDYSIHMITKIPSICALRDISRVIKLFEERGDEDHFVRGFNDFRIDCNVPYAMNIRRTAHDRARGRVIPLSDATEVDYGVTLSMPTVGGTPTANCTEAQVRDDARDCASLGGAGDMRQFMPRAKARMIVVRRPKETVGAPPEIFAGDFDAMDPVVTSGAATTTSASPGSGVPGQFTLSLTARF